MVAYDAPNLYCYNGGDWPPFFTCTNDPMPDADHLVLSDSGGAFRWAYIYFENGVWDTGIDIPCGATHSYQATIQYLANDLSTISSASTPLTSLPVTPLATKCPDRQTCPGGTGVGLPVNIGSGDVSTMSPLFNLSQDPFSLPFALTYHSSAAMFPSLVSSPVGVGWTHEYAQTLRPEDGTNNRLYRISPEGYEEEYQRIAPDATWIAIYPAELRGTIALVGSEYQLTDLNGTMTSFDVTTGHWNSTKDRWQNTISGTYAAGQLTTITDSMGRQVLLAYSAGQVTITLPGSLVWKLTLGTNNTLTQIFDPLHTGATPWRSFTYQNDHASILRLLTSVKDDASKELEAHTYDATTDRGLTSSQAGATRSNVSISYDDVGNTRTVTHTIDGTTTQTTTFNLIYQGGRWLPTQISGNCATCGGAESDLQVLVYDYANHVTDRKVGSGGEQVETQYTYDGNGMMLSRSDPVGSTTYTYAVGTPSGFVALWPAFMLSASEVSVGKPGGSNFKTTSFAWSTTGSCAGQSNERCLVSSVAGFQKPSDGSRTTYTTVSKYDSKHRPIEIDGPAPNQKSTSSYLTDAATNNGGRLGQSSLCTTAACTAGTGRLDTAYDLYDIFGTATKVLDPNLVETDRTTDSRGRVTSVVSKKPAGDANEAADYTTGYAFDSRDRLTDVALPRSNKIHYDYEDGTNRLLDTVRVDSAGLQQERLLLTLNVIGDKVQEDAQVCNSPAASCAAWTTKRIENFKYDVHNRLLEIDHSTPSNSKVVYAYDSRGNVKSVQDENHLSSPNTVYAYDSRNRLTSVVQTLTGASATAGLCPASAGQIATCYSYDLQDNLTQVVDPNTNQTTFAYDDFRRMQSQVSPVSGTTTYSYDEAGNLTKSADARQSANPGTDGTIRTYDVANRILTAAAVLTGQATETVTWTYDDATAKHYGLGRVAKMTDPSGSTSYKYERRGLLLAEDKTIDLSTYSLRYGFDANGNRSSIRYPSGRLVSYTFDFGDRPSTACSGGTGPTCTGGTSYVTSAGYQPFGPESSLAYGNGTTKTVTYDQRYRPIENKLAGGSTIGDFFYSEDAVRNITSICAASGACTTPAAAFDRVFGYDDLNRLTAAKSGSSLWGAAAGNGYTYDKMGNVTAVTLGTSGTFRTATFAYSGTTPKLTSTTESGLGTRTVSYDASGNEITVGSGAFTYSSRNYLASGDNLAYGYDGRGLRVSTSRTGVTLFPIRLTIDPQSVKGGTSVTGTVTLNDTTGATVTLTTSDASVASLAGTVLVPGGSAFATFTINTSAIGSDSKAVISATLNGVTVPAVVTVTAAPRLVLLSLSPRTVQEGGGRTSTGTVTLNGGSLAGTTVTLLSSNPAVAAVPASVPITTGLGTATFTVTTSSVTGTTPVDIKASFGGVDQHAVLTVVSFAVQGKAPLEPRWAGVGSPLLMASLAPWRESSAEYVWAPSSSGGLNLRLGEGDTEGEDLERDQGRSIEAATFPGPPKRNFLYSPEMSLLAESELSTPREQKILYEYIWFNGHPVAQVDGQAVTHWTFTDHLGTPLIQTTASQAVWWRAEYEPYGRVWAYNPSGLADQHQPLRLPGQEAEQFNLGSNGATERSYNVFRWYRGGWGRYSQPDPESRWWSVRPDPFGYADSRPEHMIDPIGLFRVDGSCKATGLDASSGIRDSCSRAMPGTKCHRALSNISAALGPGNDLPSCFKKNCEGGTVLVRCEPCQSECARTQGGFPPTVTIGGGNDRCPNNRGLGLGETMFHETLHVCGFPLKEFDEPDLPGSRAAWFRYAEDACYNWRDPNAPPIGPPLR